MSFLRIISVVLVAFFSSSSNFVSLLSVDRRWFLYLERCRSPGCALSSGA